MSVFTAEVIGTKMLVLFGNGVVANVEPADTDPVLGLGSLGLLPVALLIFGISMSLGGTTGYGINPARDLGPRLVHALLPIKNKRDSDWKYAWVPIAGPNFGGINAARVYQMLVA